MPPSAKVKILDTFTGLHHEQAPSSETDCPDQDLPRSHHHPPSSSVSPSPALSTDGIATAGQDRSGPGQGEAQILADGADFAILRLIQERPAAAATTALATLSPTHPPSLSMVVCERDNEGTEPARLRLQQAKHCDREQVSPTEATIIGTNHTIRPPPVTR